MTKTTLKLDRDWVTAKEFYQTLGMSHITLRKWIQEGRLPGCSKHPIGVWMIPSYFLKEVEKPKRGRPKKNAQRT